MLNTLPLHPIFSRTFQPHHSFTFQTRLHGEGHRLTCFMSVWLTAAPLNAGINGLAMTMAAGDPIHVSYDSDYSEQCPRLGEIVLGGYQDDCPTCDCPYDELGLHPCQHDLCDLNAVLNSLGYGGKPQSARHQTKLVSVLGRTILYQLHHWTPISFRDSSNHVVNPKLINEFSVCRFITASGITRNA